MLTARGVNPNVYGLSGFGGYRSYASGDGGMYGNSMGCVGCGLGELSTANLLIFALVGAVLFIPKVRRMVGL